MISKIFASFWFFGLINNVLYVVILSAAVDLVGPLVPKSTVLLADILPAFLVKLTAPFYIHKIPYGVRVVSLIGMSVVGMLFVTYGSISSRLFGVVLASLSSGLGELTFLQLTHFYKDTSLNGWSSGTGAAGLVGSGFYLMLTTVLKVSVRKSLLLFTVFPLGFLSYFRLPEIDTYQRIEQNEDTSYELTETINMKEHIMETLRRVSCLFKPFIVPLSSVYFSEYLINQSVAPTLLFPIESVPFEKYRDIYVTYGTLYQMGVFISRSSASVVRIHNLYIPSILQFLNLVILILQSLFYFIPSVYIIMVIIFYEGLLGGASYVNTFMKIIEVVPDEEREFVLGTATMGDSFGILLSAFLGLWLEPKLCGYQVHHGRDWCRAH